MSLLLHCPHNGRPLPLFYRQHMSHCNPMIRHFSVGCENETMPSMDIHRLQFRYRLQSTSCFIKLYVFILVYKLTLSCNG